jgi:sporulation protein YlmC with PRC-barrel domain
MRFTEVRKRDVVATDDAETIGRIEHLVVDPTSHTVSALRLGKVKGDDHYVSWSELGSFGQDVVTVPRAVVLRPADDEREENVRKETGILGKRVLSDNGRDLGEVEDVEFDPETGEVTTVITDAEQIAGERLRGIGSYAVVVRRV